MRGSDYNPNLDILTILYESRLSYPWQVVMDILVNGPT